MEVLFEGALAHRSQVQNQSNEIIRQEVDKTNYCLLSNAASVCAAEEIS